MDDFRLSSAAATEFNLFLLKSMQMAIRTINKGIKMQVRRIKAKVSPLPSSELSSGSVNSDTRSTTSSKLSSANGWFSSSVLVVLPVPVSLPS